MRFLVSAAIAIPGRLIVFAVVDRVLPGAMFSSHFQMAIGIDMSERETLVAAGYPYYLK